MKAVCIGAGRLAHHLMPQLQRAGWDIIQVYNRTSWTSELLAKKLSIADHTTELNEINKDADLYVIAVSDDVVSEVAKNLHAIGDIGGIVVHCSGVLGIDVLPFRRRGVFYPLQTFSEHHEVEWHETPIIITSDDKDVSGVLKHLAVKISSLVYEMNDEQKTAIHLAAVFANNFTNHMLATAEKICLNKHVPFEILKPLIEMTVHKALSAGPSLSQTGPAIRGDENTIEKHLQMLEEYPDLKEVYRAITNSIRSDDFLPLKGEIEV